MKISVSSCPVRSLCIGCTDHLSVPQPHTAPNLWVIPSTEACTCIRYVKLSAILLHWFSTLACISFASEAAPIHQPMHPSNLLIFLCLQNTSSAANYPISNQFMIGDYVLPGSMVLPSQGLNLTNFKAGGVWSPLHVPSPSTCVKLLRFSCFESLPLKINLQVSVHHSWTCYSQLFSASVKILAINLIPAPDYFLF